MMDEQQRQHIEAALQCARMTLDELPEYPVRYDAMTENERKIADICSQLAGSMIFIMGKLEQATDLSNKGSSPL